MKRLLSLLPGLSYIVITDTLNNLYIENLKKVTKVENNVKIEAESIISVNHSGDNMYIRNYGKEVEFYVRIYDDFGIISRPEGVMTEFESDFISHVERLMIQIIIRGVRGYPYIKSSGKLFIVTSTSNPTNATCFIGFTGFKGELNISGSPVQVRLRKEDIDEIGAFTKEELDLELWKYLTNLRWENHIS